VYDTCVRCNSRRIIPGVPLLDHFGDMGWFSRQASVDVQGAPKKLVFKDKASGTLTLHICGDCGHAALMVSDFRELYEKYEQSQRT